MLTLKSGKHRYKLGDNEYLKQYWIKNPKKYLLHNAKQRARLANLEFSISEQDYEIPEYCPILGIKLSGVRNIRSEKNACPSLDRVDSTKGYIPGNVQVISFRANQYKSDMTLDIAKALVRYMEGNEVLTNPR